ncbi:MAG: hypothetical protein ACYTEQ_27705, partial [Planctomycetota bacterium]
MTDVDTLNDIQFLVDEAINRHEARLHLPHTYDDWFEAFWDAYPSRGRAENPKKPALASWRSAVKHGAAPEDIIYAA